MQPINILLIEDNEGDILLITEAFEEGKISNSLKVIKNGWDAIQYLQLKDGDQDFIMPDLVILDVNLPKLNGHETLKMIKENISTRHLPVIMLTTSSEEEDIYKAYQNYVNCYITKPIAVHEFLKVVVSIEKFWISLVKLPHKS